MRIHLGVALAIISIAAAAQQPSSGIGYPSVAAALEALKARTDVQIRVEQGWTIVNDKAAGEFWSFTPPGHPAHPAAVKRTLVEKDGKLTMNMSVLCQAGKAACDKLVAQFRELNEKLSQSMRSGAQAGPASEIQVEKLGDDRFRLVLRSFRSGSVDAGQQELFPKAAELCAGKNVRYGKYEFETSEPVDPSKAQKLLLLKQEIACGDSAGAGVAAKPDSQWRPTPAQEEQVASLTYAYFSARDAGKYREAYALFSPTQQQTVSFDRWSSRVEQFNANAGPVRSRKIKKISWYKDPPRAGPGVYAAVDYASEFENIDVHCGFVAWHMEADSSFRVMREEENFIDKATRQKLKEGELAKLRAQFGVGCR